MALEKIKQPADSVVVTENCTGYMKWSPGFAAKYNGKFLSAQKLIDSEVLRYCSTMVPLDTGRLKMSGTSSTTLGSGEVRYVTPYAAFQYYKTAETRSYDHNRGGMWFERMKVTYGESIRRIAATAL